MDQVWQWVISFGGQVLAVGTSAATIAYFAFKYFGEKWLEGLFAARLQRLKTEQDEYLKRIQSTIDREFHRAKRLYDGEFDSLLRGWNLCCVSLNAAAALRGEHRDYNLGGLTEEEAKDMLEHRLKLPSYDVAAVMAKKGVHARSELANFLREQAVSVRAHAALNEFSSFRNTHSIFWRADIGDDFKALERLATAAVREYHTACIGKPFADREFVEIERLISEGPALKDALEAKVRSRLWSVESATGD